MAKIKQKEEPKIQKTSIEWALNPDGAPGCTWNPITGCLNGCEYCYARRLANTRLKERYLANLRVGTKTSILSEYEKALGDPFYPRFWPERFDDFNNLLAINEPNFLKKLPRKSRGIFVCDMSDLFGIGVPEEWTRKVLSLIEQVDMHRFYLLTKQPQNLAKFSPFPDNCYVGVTATDAKSFLEAGRGLEQIEAKIKYISFEPLLGYVGSLWLEDWLKSGAGINQVIIGALTCGGGELAKLSYLYPELTPMPYGNRYTLQPKIEWVREIVEAADKAGVKVFLKNNIDPLLSVDVKNANSILYDQFEPMAPVLRQELPT